MRRLKNWPTFWLGIAFIVLCLAFWAREARGQEDRVDDIRRSGRVKHGRHAVRLQMLTPRQEEAGM